MTPQEAETLWAEANALVESLGLRLNVMVAYPEFFRKQSIGRALMMQRSAHSELKTCIIRKDTNAIRPGPSAGGPGTAGSD